MFDQLQKHILRFHGHKVLVVGDVMLDEHIWSTVSRISPEAPVPIAKVESITHVPGGAGNVACNVAALGGTALLVGVIGKDSSAQKLKSALRRSDVAAKNLVELTGRPTTLKSRVIAHQQHVVRVDREDISPIPPPIEKRVLQKIEHLLPQVSAVVLSDYGKGLLTKSLCRRVITLAKKNRTIILTDPKTRDLSKYRGTSIVTPNLSEAALASQIEITDTKSLRQAAHRLIQSCRANAILITQGKDGMTYYPKRGEAIHVPAIQREVFDITGAGDSVIGTLALALASGIPIHQALILATCAAGVAIGKVGTAPVTREELLEFISEDHYFDQIRKWKISPRPK